MKDTGRKRGGRAKTGEEIFIKMYQDIGYVERCMMNGADFVPHKKYHVRLTVNVSEYTTSANVTSKPFNSSFNL